MHIILVLLNLRFCYDPEYGHMDNDSPASFFYL